MTTDKERRDLYLFAKDNKLADAQIDIVLSAYQDGAEYSACIETIKKMAEGKDKQFWEV
jgi:hypothetical protein